MSSSPASLAGLQTLAKYKEQLAVLGTLPHFQTPGAPQSSSAPSTSGAASVSTIAAQQQQLLVSKAMETQNQLQLEKNRISLLLEINSELLKEVMDIQPTLKSVEEGKNSPEFKECMRRLQINLAYLAALADRTHKPGSQIPPCPSILRAPPEMSILQGLYRRLQELYPGIDPANPPTLPQQQNPNNPLGPPPLNRTHLELSRNMGGFQPPPTPGNPPVRVGGGGGMSNGYVGGGPGVMPGGNMGGYNQYGAGSMHPQMQQRLQQHQQQQQQIQAAQHHQAAMATQAAQANIHAAAMNTPQRMGQGGMGMGMNTMDTMGMNNMGSMGMNNMQTMGMDSMPGMDMNFMPPSGMNNIQPSGMGSMQGMDMNSVWGQGM